nr:hypothetical protein [Eubacterium sp.]
MDSKRVSVNMTKKALVEYVLVSYYTRLSGFFSIILGIIGIVLFVIGYTRGARYQAMAVYAFIAVLSLIGNPIMLIHKAKVQAATSPAYKNPITYDITPEGLTISVVVPDEDEHDKDLPEEKSEKKETNGGDNTGISTSDKNIEQEKLEWRHIYRLRLGRKMLAIHTSPIHAFILPLTELGDSLDEVAGLLVKYS